MKIIQFAFTTTFQKFTLPEPVTHRHFPDRKIFYALSKNLSFMQF